MRDIYFLGGAAAAAKSLQSCPTLCDPIDGNPPGSPVPGILQARTLEWAAISFSNAWKWKVEVKSLSRVRLSATPWTAADALMCRMVSFVSQSFPVTSPEFAVCIDSSWKLLVVQWLGEMVTLSMSIYSFSFSFNVIQSLMKKISCPQETKFGWGVGSHC